MGRVVLILALALTSGCATFKNWLPASVAKDQRPSAASSEPVKITTPLKDNFVSVLLEEFYTASNDPAFGSLAYLSTAKEQYAKQKNEKTLLKYTLAALLAGSAEELAKAQELLKGIEADLKNVKSDESVLGLAALLQRLLSQQKDLQTDLVSTKQQVKEKDAQLAKLHEQINAIKSIEKNIHERRVGTAGEGSR